jgi:hypothetical protein
MANRYFLKADHETKYTEVTKEQWIRAERAAGFRPKMSQDHPNYMTTEATGGFGGRGISGRIEYEKE